MGEPARIRVGHRQLVARHALASDNTSDIDGPDKLLSPPTFFVFVSQFLTPRSHRLFLPSFSIATTYKGCTKSLIPR